MKNDLRKKPNGKASAGLSRRSFVVTGAALATSLLTRSRSDAASITTAKPRQEEVLIKNASILSCDPGIGTIEGGDVHIRSGMIVGVGRDLSAPSATVIDGTGFAIVPGLVDTHWHMWTSLMRNGSDNRPGNGYFPLTTRIGNIMRPHDAYLGTLLSAFEALNCGITTVHNWSHNIRTPQHAREELQALREAGLRARFSYGANRALPPSQPINVQDFVALNDQWKEHSEDGLIHLGMGWRGIQFIAPNSAGKPERRPISEDVWRTEYDAAASHNIPISLHANSTLADMGHVAELEKKNLLNNRLQIIHATNIADDEIEYLARRGTSVSLSPYSEMAIGFGIPPVARLIKAGVTTGLSIDTTPLTGSADMFAVAKVIQNLHNGQSSNEMGMDGQRALDLATIVGAKALGLDDVTGSITPKKRADLLMINIGGLSMQPMSNLAHAIVHSANPADIDTVFVDGRIVKRGGKLVRVDTAELTNQTTSAYRELQARVKQ